MVGDNTPRGGRRQADRDLLAKPFEMHNLSLSRRPASLSDEVTQVLRREIHERRLLPGDRLPTENELARSFGVSRTVIREAIAKLRADGLVDPRQGAGVFVTHGSSNHPFRIHLQSGREAGTILDVFELRIGIESEAAALAAERRTDRQLEEIESLRNTIIGSVRRGTDATAEDVDFHRAISEATNNSQFVEFIRFIAHHLYDAVRIARQNSARFEGRPALVEQEHDAVVRAIREQDPTAAHAAMREHLQQARMRLMEGADELETLLLRNEEPGNH